MNPHPYLEAFRRSWVVLLSLVIVGGLVGFGLSAIARPAFTASAKLYFGPATSSSATDLNQGATYTQNQMLTFAQLATSPIVLKQVIADESLRLTPGALGDDITATTPQNTSVLIVSVTQSSATTAAAVANAVASRLSTTVEDLAPTTATNRKAVRATVVAAATPPSSPSSPDTRRNVLAGLLIGLVLGALIMYLRFRLDTRVRSVDDLAGVTDAPILGTLDAQRAPLQVTESHRKLAGNVIASAQDTSKVLVVASSTSGEGAAGALVGLAAALTERRYTVLVVDADFRQARLAAAAGLPPSEHGLWSTLTDAGDSIDDGIIQASPAFGFDVLPAGTVIGNPSAALSSPALAALFDRFRDVYDFVFISASAIVETADATTVATHADGILIVADSTRVREVELVDALDAIASAGERVFGVVLTRLRSTPTERREAAAQRNRSSRSVPAATIHSS